MSQAGGAAGQPSSYHTNVNRAKTKKWVEAKSYSYDGDDWGEADEYDEYGGYNEPEPEPAPRPTGFRQRGQSANKTPQEIQGPRYDQSQSPAEIRQPYNIVGGPNPQQGSPMNPRQQQPLNMTRTGSFDSGDERRNFSSGTLHQASGGTSLGPNRPPQPQGHNVATQDFQPADMYGNQPPFAQQTSAGSTYKAPNYSNIEARDRYGNYPQSAGGSNRVPTYAEQQRQANAGSRAQSMTSNISSSDLHNRRDFTPSAMPLPLHTRGSPSPHGNPDSRSSSRHPPRKSSMNNESQPNISSINQPPSIPAAEDESFAGRHRSGSNTSNAPALIRPADIYRRMQEEKEKERISQEIPKSNADLVANKGTEGPSLGRPQDSESSQRSKPALDPVTERKSEYGMDSVNINDQTPPRETRPSTAKRFELPKRAPNTHAQTSESGVGPMLPEVNRMSGFGESFGQSFLGSGDDFVGSASSPTVDSTDPPMASKTQEPIPNPPEKNLKNQPSLGFTSAVHQAFDKAEDQIPPTPSSTYGSTVGRSTSGGTSTVSPIISRGPSTATENMSARLPGIDSRSTPSIAERTEGSNSRPLSSDSLGTPKQIVKKPPPSNTTSSPVTDTQPSSFIPGHRRDLSTPSPDNSPARTLAVESNRQLRQPQEVELSAATPTDQGFDAGSQFGRTSAAKAESPGHTHPFKTSDGDPSDSRPDTQHVPVSMPGRFDTKALPSPTRPRTNSSPSRRVRDLADRFENNSRPGSPHSNTTPRASVLSNQAPRKDEFAPPRPLVDRNESFRPHLPGGWESSASIAPTIGQRRLETYGNPADVPLTSTGTTCDSAADSKKPIDDLAGQRPSAVIQVKDASEEAFIAVAAAGTALAGAFAAAIGMEHHDPATGSNDDTPSSEQRDTSEIHQSASPIHNVSANTIMHPETVETSLPPSSEEEKSVAAPTIIPDYPPTLPRKADASSENAKNFPSPSPSEQDFSIHDSPSEERRQPPTLPLLTTAAQPHEYESDRLRKEIVKELTPMSASEPTTAETDASNYNDISRLSTTSSVRPGHESGVLPQEYESYWNDAHSDDENSQPSAELMHTEQATLTHAQHNETLHVSDIKQPMTSDPVVSGELSQDRPQMLPHRFSWEAPLQDLSLKLKGAQDEPIAPASDFSKSAFYPGGGSPPPTAVTSNANPVPATPLVTATSYPEPPRLPEKDFPAFMSNDILGLEKATRDNVKDMPSDPHSLEASPFIQGKGHEQPYQLSSPGGLDGTARASQNPGNVLNDAHDRPVLEHTQHQTVSSLDRPPSPPPTNVQPRIPPFRELLALKTPRERIEGYDSAREQFAITDTGLTQWLAATAKDHPEHADLLAGSGTAVTTFQGHKPSLSRSKLGSFLPGQATAADGTTLGTPNAGGSSQGYSPSGGSGSKISSQQVQAKGKDLLHTAGVFGGKANVAAKGLFSKGRSKFRAASGTEKATSRSTPDPEPLSRGMQYRPKGQQIPQPSSIHETDSSNTLSGSAPLEAQSLPHTPDQLPSIESPSLASCTPSNEGDDELSEDSVLTREAIPPRLSSLHDTRYKEKELLQQPVIIGDSAPIFLRQTAAAESYVGSPKEIHTPRSATSSNITPTQSNFKDLKQPEFSADPRAESDTSGYHQKADQGFGAVAPRQSSPSVPRPSFADDAVTLTSSNSHERDNQPSFPKDSRNKFHISDGTNMVPRPDQDQPSLQNVEIDRLMTRAPARLSALRQSEVAKPTPLQLHKDAGGLNERLSMTRSISPVHTSQRKLHPSQDNSLRTPSIDGFPSPVSPYHPPPPVQPPQSSSPFRSQQRELEGPVHYGIEHDFVPERDRERTRSRSPSHRGPYQGRPSQDSRPSYEPNLDDHPAFRKSEDVDNGSRRRSTSKPSSRRSSRSSAFFRALGKSPDGDVPALPGALDSEASSTPINTPTTSDKRRRSMNVLRSLTGKSGSGSLKSKENVTTTASKSQPQHARTEPISTPKVEDDEFPMRDMQSKWSKRLQRSSTSGDTPDSSKKKRFSAIGSLFGRGHQKRQSNSYDTQLLPQQNAFAQRQEYDSYNATPPLRPSEAAYRPPTPEYSAPPPGGYYAPGRPEIDPRVDGAFRSSDSRWQDNRLPTHRSTDTPAYIQDSSLRQQVSPTAKGQKSSTARSSRPSYRSPQPSSSNIPQPSSIRQVSKRESRPERSNHESQPSGSSWTRFSARARSKSRSSQPPQPPLNGSASPHPTTYEFAPASRSNENFRRSFHDADRSDSPPPPPPPPKDDWHKPRPHGHSQTPSQSSNRPLSSTQNRQSLPPLQTDVHSNRNSNMKPGKQMTPEEKRESRRLEIERSTLSPAAAAAAATTSPIHRHVIEDEEENIVMSATSFPGQLWQPDYAHWDGD